MKDKNKALEMLQNIWKLYLFENIETALLVKQSKQV